LPHIEKLYQRYKDSSDVRIVTFNVDQNIGLLGAFMKENGYTFPVIPAEFLVRSLVPMLSIPRNWLIDGAGVMRFESVGFGGDVEKWMEQLVEMIDSLRAGTPASVASSGQASFRPECATVLADER
jgi:hypothetical protein